MKRMDIYKVDEVVLHCSASNHCDEKKLYEWHVVENGWDAPGYSYLVRKSGKVVELRGFNYFGAHVEGDNSHTLGICLEGRGNFDFTDVQIKALKDLLASIFEKLPNKEAKLKGHFEYPSAIEQGKTCPMAKGEKFERLLERLQ